jgi:phage terminase large subunit GpA-like protein
MQTALKTSESLTEEQKVQSLIKAFFTAIKPSPPMLVSVWADNHRYLSQRASAEPGKWRTERTPYLKPIMDWLSTTSDVEEVVLMKGAQIGGSECANNFLGYVIDGNSPGPFMMVLPTVDLAKRTSKQRIAPLIEESPKLKGKVKDVRSRDSGNTLLMKDFEGGVLVLTGANSAVGLRSLPAKYLVLDEQDAYPADADGEGDPSALAEARQRTFARKKRLKISTPTFEGRSAIKESFRNSERHWYYLPCPHCNQKQVLKFDRLKWDKGKPETAAYICENCDAMIEERHKTWMLANGEMICENPGEFGGKIKGAHISSLYSPLGWLSWADIAREWIKSQGNQEKLRVFVNTILGETWKEKGEAPEWERIYERREDYKIGVVPKNALVITGSGDVQKDRIEYEICGWCRDFQTYSVEVGLIMGDTSTDEPWLELDNLMLRKWRHENGAEMSLRMFAIDSGHATQRVYNWARKQPMNRVMVVKGGQSTSVALGLPKDVDVMSNGKRLRRGVKLWTLGVGLMKSELYAWLQIKPPVDGEPYPRFFCHFPDYSSDYFKQLCSEQIVVRIVRGVRRYIWEKIQERNEALDLKIYNRACSLRLGMDRWSESDWNALEAELTPSSDGPITPRRRERPKSTDDYWG